MKRTKRKFTDTVTPGRVMGLAFVILCLCFGMMVTDAKAPVDRGTALVEATQAPVQNVLENEKKVEAGCEVTQTMGFTRCGHSVTRRITAPERVIGMDFSAFQEYYDLWQIESFSSTRVAMSREISLFCPMHQVLTVNEAGDVVLSQNQYGDGMAVLRTYPISLSQFDEETQEALRLGLGFDSEEEAAAWLGER